MQSAAQLAQIENVSGAPFTATWTWAKVETKSGQAETRTILATAQLARDKNGSTYAAVSEDGHTTSIWIVDVLKNRKIEILPRDSTYHYIPIPNPGGKLPTYSMEWMFKMLQAEQQYLIEHPDSPSRSPKMASHSTWLSTGERIQSLWRQKRAHFEYRRNGNI